MMHQKRLKRYFSVATSALLFCLAISQASAGNEHKKSMIKYREIVDLSHPITTTIPLWPGDPAVEFETVATLENDGYYLRRFSIGEHSATHMNAPNSFIAGGMGIDGYTPESLVNPAVVIDVSEQSALNPDYVISISDITNWEQQHGRIKPGTLVLFYTGWQHLWDSPSEFLNIDNNGALHFPGVGGDTSLFLLEEREIAGIGIDTHGADPGIDEQYATNTQVLERNGIILECLNNLDQLPPKGTTVVIGMPRLENGSGTPVAVTAFTR